MYVCMFYVCVYMYVCVCVLCTHVYMRFMYVCTSINFACNVPIHAATFEQSERLFIEGIRNEGRIC